MAAKTIQPPAAVQKTIVITRFDPDKDEAPRKQEYSVPCEDNWKVLDAVNFIKDEIDASVSYRWSCRMAVCGSCGMMVNGEPKLTCKTSLKEYGERVDIEPLANFPVVRDLVVELDGFMHKFESVKPWIMRAKEKAEDKAAYDETKGTFPQSVDSRDEGNDERHEIFRGEGTIFSCSYANECSEVCPKNVDPAAAVNQAKFGAVIDWAKGLVLPSPSKSGGAK
jgi:fumarate reductase iron-sulfur subunit